jgi:hypothetical protein
MVPDAGHGVRVDDSAPPTTLESLKWQSQIVEHALVAVIQVPVGTIQENERGKGVDEPLQTRKVGAVLTDLARPIVAP